MAGMLQIITYLLAVYLIVKGIEVLQIALASNRSSREGMIWLGGLTLVACLAAAATFVGMQDAQARSMSAATSSSYSGF